MFRAAILTAHTYRCDDASRLNSLDLAKLCRRDRSYTYENGGGLECPSQVCDEICDTIETLMAQVLCKTGEESDDLLYLIM